MIGTFLFETDARCCIALHDATPSFGTPATGIQLPVATPMIIDHRAPNVQARVPRHGPANVNDASVPPSETIEIDHPRLFVHPPQDRANAIRQTRSRVTPIAHARQPIRRKMIELSPVVEGIECRRSRLMRA
jgi:hypothetical protein